MNQLAVIGCRPINLNRLPAQLQQLAAQVHITSLHTAAQCDDCQDLVWIGPEQRRRAQQQQIPVICYVCLLPYLAGNDFTTSVLNPVNDLRPRHPLA